jgi:hypothetical protein
MRPILKTLLALTFIGIIFYSCNNFGKKVKAGHVEVYYKDGISKEDAQKTADLLLGIDEASNNAPNQKSMQLVKIKDTITFRMVIDKEKLAGVQDLSFYAIGIMLSDSLFNHSPVNVELTDNLFKTIKTLHFKGDTQIE